jgi:hypothetical protein
LKPSGKPSTKKPSPQQAREEAIAAARSKQLPADPLSPQNLRSIAIRVGIPVVIAWAIALFLNGPIPKIVVGVLTLLLAGLAIWAVRFARRSRAVAAIVRDADSPEARKQAIEKLDADFKKDDTAAVFAKAQLQMQEDPRLALATLETIKLDKVMAPVADEARIQRAMIHLILGETEAARQLADPVDLSRHKEPKSRAMMAAIIAEAWARTGQAKKAVEMLETLDPEDATFAELRPQLLRARAFAYAWASNSKQMKQTLRRMMQLNPQFLSGFVTNKKVPGGVSPKGVHPLLEKEALDMLAKSGTLARRVEMRRG